MDKAFNFFENRCQLIFHLVIVTHINCDRIGGIVAFLEDCEKNCRVGLKEIWHNVLFQIGGKKFLECSERDVEQDEEMDNNNEKIVFGYERFYEIIIAQSVLGATENETIQRIYKIQEKQQMTIGMLELIQILFMLQFQQEILEYFIPEEWDIGWIESYGESLYWKMNHEVTSETKKFVKFVKYFSKNNKEEKVRTISLVILGVSTKVDFDLNAEYLYTFLIKQLPLWRNYYLSYFLLGNFEKEKIICDICIRSQKLANYEATERGSVVGDYTFLVMLSK